MLLLPAACESATPPSEVASPAPAPPRTTVSAPSNLHTVPDQGEGDYDGDGRLDRYVLTHDGGSGAAYRHLSVTLGDGRTLEADAGGSFGVRTELVRAPVPWRTPDRLHNLAWMLFGTMDFTELEPERGISSVTAASAAVHPAAQWVWDAMALPPLPAAPGVLRGGAWTPRWEPGLPTSPGFTLAIVTQPSVLRAATDGDPSDLGLLAISHWGLERLEAGVRCGDRQLYVAAHGVAVHDTVADRSAWLWVSGVPGVSEAQKLRWRSIEAVSCLADGLVQVELALAERRRVVIDPAVARWVEISATEAAAVATIAAALRPRVVDLDGDTLPDPITWTFTGGAHCCYEPTVALSRTGAVKLPVALDGGVVFDAPWAGVRGGEALGHGTCGEGLEERPTDRCYVGELAGKPALLMRETYSGRDTAPGGASQRAGKRSAWRSYTFPEKGGFVEADWGPVAPVE